MDANPFIRKAQKTRSGQVIMQENMLQTLDILDLELQDTGWNLHLY